MSQPLTEIRSYDDMDPITRTGMILLRDARAALTQPVERVFFAPGDEVAWDDSCGGELWIRIADIQGIIRGNCVSGYMVTYGLGVLRCVASVDDQGRAPDANRLTTDALTLQTDRRDLQCFILENVRVADSGMFTWTPDGPEGGAAMGEWLFTVAVI